ncbi:nucleoside 2-deoxyribosyltransferase [Natranaeroarchaeum sulfidigenes]|uniref:Putative 2'-deoxynucleoside 5'-phosphate N-hydrolase 1 n=1 Tax=Natranaeroarchaeum sulfidigenes TaxID=2784880 RepID=A0A897MLY0_9EURY|nr:nucleoside 2-deoxyribosyltransferase [Natranaeroarchaeum sulfidigenes]QSG01617.1 Nucleoside 2-deoxyribosyltransferase [Natranaeroarchaeum sulfidigenes]
MNLFFSASIRGGRDDVDLYADLINHLNRHGDVLTEHIGEQDVEAKEQAQGLTDADIYNQDVYWLREADAVIAEVTTPSLGVGYELGRAVAWDKPVLALYRPDADHELSAMVRGNPDVEVVEYETLDDARPTIDAFLSQHV